MGNQVKKKKGLIASGISLLVIIACIGLGSILGAGSFTFYYAQGGSYFSNDSKSCANCHIMQDHYAAWSKSSHKNVAQCNDCHSPPGGEVEKLYCKGMNGFHHSAAFTLGTHQDQLTITDFNREITERSCRKCHADINHGIEVISQTNHEKMSCIRCHNSVGHATH